ncbi:MAG: hypothetical protein LBK76_01030 [Verrucomicrobiales bacterium]|nr:hypothetical protein [Verrucomicrobiales bacterium]
MNIWLWQLLWASSAGLLGAWALTVMWRKKSAAWRCLGWRLGLLAVLAGGALTVTSWRVELPWLAARETVAVVADVGVVETVTVSEATPAVPLPLMPARAVDWWLVIWLSGAALCLLPLTAGWWRVRRLLQNARPFADGRRVLVSADVAVPLTVGVCSPRIVLPAAASAWPAERVRRVLAHESAHGQRRDVAWALLARMVCALCWFNPLAWFAAHRQRVEAELACDDAVLAGGAAADDYATDLLQILRACPRGLPSPLMAGMAARPSQIRARLRALLAVKAERGVVSRGMVWGLTVSVLLLAAALTVLRLSPTAPPVAADAPAADGELLPKDGEVMLSARLLRFPAKARATQSGKFKRAWAAGEVEKIVELGAAAGAELVAMPVVVTKSGIRSTVKLVKEMPFPARWDFSGTLPPPITTVPADHGHPSQFTKEDVGLTVEFVPRILDQGIELNLTVRSVTTNAMLPESRDVSFNKQEMHLARLLRNGGSFAVWLPWEQGNYNIPGFGGSSERQDERPGRYGLIVSAVLVEPPRTVSAVAAQLRRITIPRVAFTDAPVAEVLDYLQAQSKLRDPLKAGVNIVFKAEPTEALPDWPGGGKLTLDFTSVSLEKILEVIQTLVPYTYRVEEQAVYVFPRVEINEPLLVRAFAVPDGFFSAPIETLTVDAVKQELVEKGVAFLRGTQVVYVPEKQKLVVRNTAAQLEQLTALLKTAPRAVSAARVAGRMAAIDAQVFAVPKKAKLPKEPWVGMNRAQMIKTVTDAGGVLAAESTARTILGKDVKIKATRELRYPMPWNHDRQPAQFTLQDVGLTMEIRTAWAEGKIALRSRLMLTVVEGFLHYGSEQKTVQTPILRLHERTLLNNLRDGESVMMRAPDPELTAAQAEFNDEQLVVVLTARLLNAPTDEPTPSENKR